MDRLAQANRNRQAIEELLAVDDVLTDAMLSRVGLDGTRFPGLTLSVQPMRKSSWTVDVTFRAVSDSRLRDAPISSLSHAAGTAAMRWQLAASAEQWTIDRGGRFHRPDAVMKDGEELIAMEYDAGYDRRTIRRKVRQFEPYSRLVWATPSAIRSARMKADYPHVEVITVDYWSAQT